MTLKKSTFCFVMGIHPLLLNNNGDEFTEVKTIYSEKLHCKGNIILIKCSC